MSAVAGVYNAGSIDDIMIFRICFKTDKKTSGICSNSVNADGTPNAAAEDYDYTGTDVYIEESDTSLDSGHFLRGLVG